MIDNNEPLFEDNIPDKAKFSDEKTKNKIHHHLNNANDVISDDDIKNVRTDIEVQAEPSQGFSEEELKKAEEEEELKQKDDDDDQPIISSWNILGT